MAEITFVEDYEQVTGESTEAATKRFQAETKVVTPAVEAPVSKSEDESSAKAETKA